MFILYIKHKILEENLQENPVCVKIFASEYESYLATSLNNISKDQRLNKKKKKKNDIEYIFVENIEKIFLSNKHYIYCR